jgi:pyridoxal phosphate enzyme (YggS family)
MRAAAERAGRDPAAVTLVAATKGVEPVRLEQAIDAGLTDCGENIVQDAEERIAALGERAKQVRWHFIGHLQSNKAGAALRLFDILESVDSERLAEQLSRRAETTARLLLEVNVALEPSKFGFRPDEVAGAVATISRLPNLQLDGLMTVAPAVADPEQVRPVFRELRRLAEANGLRELSMGMTNDFEIAIEEGATSVRVGRAIFGERA